MKFQRQDDVDIYKIRNHMYDLRKTRYGLEVNADVLYQYLGATRPSAHYDPLGGYMGREWTFVNEQGEPYMVCQSYKNFYVTNRQGGFQLRQFRDWVVEQLGPVVGYQEGEY